MTLSANNSSSSATAKSQKRVLSEKAHLERMLKMKQRGKIEIIMGPMFSGKSTELLRRVNRLEISGKKCLSVKFAQDMRYDDAQISTHDK